ncbi:hypothetical protein AVEN_261915-1 [Araneus ventricosus]|uniref:Uncharacterized protein n=1 Tax=Araneus ventricosus TaxID=182803 RepID=A0A4Y2LPI2_ARAVE|nr:hypothetical protein AVEN_261915-1 [Araneus ventricosus]
MKIPYEYRRVSCANKALAPAQFIVDMKIPYANYFVQLRIAVDNELQAGFYHSRVAQWKRAGPITQRSVDRNHALLETLFTA